MAICVHLVPVSMNAGQYQQAVKLIAEAGQGAPPGRMYHVTFGNKLEVVDVWRSQGEWEDFSAFVTKASEQVGIEVASLTIEPVVDIITP
jgi:muconolactone delta-isomerase